MAIPRVPKGNVLNPQLLRNLTVVGWIYVACAVTCAMITSFVTAALPTSTSYELGMVRYI